MFCPLLILLLTPKQDLGTMDSQSSSPRRCSSALSERALRKNNGTLAVASTNGGTLPTRKRAYSVFPSIAPPLDDPVDGAAVHDSDHFIIIIQYDRGIF